MTQPTPPPEKQNLPAPSDDAGENTSPPERDGFFNRVRRELKPLPTEEDEIVIMPCEGEEGPNE